MTTTYIVFWKDAPGQQVNTVVDEHDNIVRRDDQYLSANSITKLDTEADILVALHAADGKKYAVRPDLARRTLGWDV